MIVAVVAETNNVRHHVISIKLHSSRPIFAQESWKLKLCSTSCTCSTLNFTLHNFAFYSIVYYTGSSCSMKYVGVGKITISTSTTFVELSCRVVELSRRDNVLSTDPPHVRRLFIMPIYLVICTCQTRQDDSSKWQILTLQHFTLMHCELFSQQLITALTREQIIDQYIISWWWQE